MLKRLLRWVRERLERQRTRRALAALGDAALEDLGLTREEAARESRRPFWR